MSEEQGGASSSTAATVLTGDGPSTALAAETSATPASQDSADSKPELPWAFIECSAEILVVLIAHMLDLLCQHNDQVVLTPEALTRFHSRAPPGITVIDYLRRIVKYTNLEKIPLLSLLAYIDLTCQNLPSFTLSSLTVHRFLIAGVTAGSKAQCDVFCTNAHYAKVGGIKVGELNSLEREFLRITGWALCCNSDLLQQYYTSLIRSHGGYTQASEPSVSPFFAFPNSVDKIGSAPPSSAATPNDVGAEDEASFSDYDSVEGDAEVDAMAIDSPTLTRGRRTGRLHDIEIDPSETTPQHVSAGTEERDAEEGSAARTSLKSLVGGIFRRRDDGSGSQGQDVPSPQVTRSRPLSSTSTAASPSVAYGATDQPKPLTPRVRTRDERSVESLRVALVGTKSASEDSHRRARVE